MKRKLKKDDNKGISPIVSVVLLIAIAVIAAVSIYFWSAGLVTKQPTPEGPIPITAVPLDNQGHVAVANLGNKPLTLSKLNSTAGVECDFGGTVTIQPGGQAICTIPPKSGKIVLWGSGTGSTEIELSGVAEVTVTSSPGFSTSSVTQATEEDFEEGAFTNTSTGSDEVTLKEQSVVSIADVTDSGFFGGGSDSHLPNAGYPGGLAVGDINDDGKKDIIISSPGSYSNDGRVYIFFDIENTQWDHGIGYANITIYGATDGVITGPSGVLGDINNDGKDDLIIGELCDTSSCDGKVFIVYGPLSPGSYNIKYIANATISGGQYSNLGYGIFVYDINKDGKMDFMVGASNESGGNGSYYLVYGNSYSGNYNITDVYSAKITGNQSSEHVGYGPVAFGDANGDGKVDILIGSPYYDVETGLAYDNPYDGRAVLFYGPISGNLSMSSGNVTIYGRRMYDYLGWDVALYDINKDGKDDLIISSPGYDLYGPAAGTWKDRGAVAVFFSPASSGTFQFNDTLDAHGKCTFSTNADMAFTFDNSTDQKFGSAIGIGDFKGNGDIDIVIGAKDINRAFVYYDIEPTNEIYAQAYGIERYCSGADVTLTIPWDTSASLGSSILTKDVNSDNKYDLLIGSPGYHGDEGRVDILSGSFPFTLASDHGKYYSKVFDLNHLSNLTYVTWTSDEPTGTDLTIELRIGNASDVDNSSGYDILNVAGTNVSKGSISLGPGTKAQYIAYFNTSDTSKTPVLYDIQLTYKPLYTNVTYTINYASGLKWVALNRSDGTLVANETVSNCDTFYTNTKEVSTAYSYTVIYKGCDGQTKTYAV